MRNLIANKDDEDMKRAYGDMLEQCMANPEQRKWYAAWMIESPKGERIGDLCLKGLASNGAVEIGYGLLPAYWGKGYAAEAVVAMVDWASTQPGVKRIEAETNGSNAASQRVLQKAGFIPSGKTGKEGPGFVWQGAVL